MNEKLRRGAGGLLIRCGERDPMVTLDCPGGAPFTRPASADLFGDAT